MAVLSLYGRIWGAYRAWARSLIPLAFLVFVPLGLVHALPVHFDATRLDLGAGAELAGAVLAILLLAITGLLGEVFYTGAVAIALTHSHGEDGRPPGLLEVVRMVNYPVLIAIDLIFGVLVALGFVALVVPGVLVFVYLGLAAPVAEIEGRGVRAALARSIRLVRGHFWLVVAVLVPIEVLSDGLTQLATTGAHALLGDSLLAEWLTDTGTNIVLTPFYAVAAVLLTIDLIAAADGEGPRLHSAPSSR